MVCMGIVSNSTQLVVSMGTVNYSAMCGIQYGLHGYSQQQQQDMACAVFLNGDSEQ